MPDSSRLYSAEDLAFSLYEGTNIVIAPKNMDHLLDPFVSSGWLLDYRSRDFFDGHAFSRAITFDVHDNSNYIYDCNRLRTELLTTSLLRYRNCGPEAETLLDPEAASLAAEQVGLYSGGTYMNYDGKIFNEDFDPRMDSLTLAFFRIAENEELDDGQKKLYSLMFGFAMDRDIVYIGSAPGYGWSLALSHLNWKRQIFSFDPHPLYDGARRPEGYIHHTKVAITSAEQLIRLLPDSLKSYDLIWDVRGDFSDEIHYDALVLSEIQCLNDILFKDHARIRRVNIKFSTRWAQSYIIPIEGNFYILPYSKSRNLNELRYVARMGQTAILPLELATATRAWVNSEETQEEYSLFASAMLMRLDRFNYINLPLFSETEADINLFTINRNPVDDMLLYFQTPHPKTVSYFTHHKLTPDEHALDEDRILDFKSHSVVDSRVYINRKIDHLYLVIPKNVLLFRDEYRTAETFLVKGIFQDICGKYGSYDYDLAKRAGASTVKCQFARFPMTFSMRDNIISPSGHVMRIAYAYMLGRASLFMLLDKMLANIYLSQAKGSKSPTVVIDKINLSRPLLTHPCLVPKFGEIESKYSDLWHGKLELMAGLHAIVNLTGRSLSHKLMRDFPSCILSDKIGNEAYNFLTKHNIIAARNTRAQDRTESAKLSVLFPDLAADATMIEKIKFLLTHYRRIEDTHPHLFSELISYPRNMNRTTPTAGVLRTVA